MQSFLFFSQQILPLFLNPQGLHFFDSLDSLVSNGIIYHLSGKILETSLFLIMTQILPISYGFSVYLYIFFINKHWVHNFLILFFSSHIFLLAPPFLSSVFMVLSKLSIFCGLINPHVSRLDYELS